MQSDGRRLYRSGGFARAITIPVAGVFLLCIGISLTNWWPADMPDLIGLGLLLIGSCWAVIAAVRLGVWITPTTVVARSWFRTWTIPITDIRRCDRVPYLGMLLGYGESSIASMLMFTIQSGKTVSLRSTIAPRRTSRRQVEEITRILGIATDHPSSTLRTHR